jgi:hypothetical protein
MYDSADVACLPAKAVSTFFESFLGKIVEKVRPFGGEGKCYLDLAAW